MTPTTHPAPALPTAPTAIAEAEKLAWLRLIRTPQVGSKNFFYLLERAGSAQEALRLLPQLAKRGGAKGALTGVLQPIALAVAERELAQLAQLGGQLVIAADPAYPPLLRAISDAPPCISVLGNPAVLQRRLLAMVGTRHASGNGIMLANQFAQQLGAAGIITCSGLARGIDTAVHRASLTTGTVAVLAGGIDQPYPPENRDLYRAIAENGCVVSEMPWGEVAQANHFPRRNRLISGLSLAVLVVEAARRSGSLITARMAAEQGREVMAIPGSPLDPRAQGGNDIIREGALLVQTVADVVQGLPKIDALIPDSAATPFAQSSKGGLLGDWPTAPRPGLRPNAPPTDTVRQPSMASLTPDDHQVDRLRHRLLQLLSPTPIGLDAVIELLNAPPPEVLAAVTELELAGLILRSPSDQLVRVG
ncbi:MAG: DNA-protecting protein DprA [Alphaproteobacteria bacterium]|nr:DNA-protecting protein DprA [Alphaproteobacteria bacterium]